MILDSDLPWGDLLGIVGVIIYIGSYFALQAGLIRGQGYLYASLNTGAAACVLLSLASNFNLSSAIIQVTYIAISVFGMIRFYLLTHRIRFTDEEQALLAVMAPGLDKLQARRMLDLGAWRTAKPGTVLTEEGEIPSHLHFLLDGKADVQVDGQKVAELQARSLVGEISCLTGMPATATVTVREAARQFEVDVDVLNKFLARNAPVRHELESRFANQIGEKLVRANQTMLTNDRPTG